MGFQLLNLFSRQPAPVSHLAVSLDVPHRPHAHNDGGDGRMAQDIPQRRFGHLLQSDAQIGGNLLHAFIDLLLSVTPEVTVAEIAFFKGGLRGDFSRQAPFIQAHPYNHADPVTFTGGQQRVFRALFKNIIDDLDGIYGAGLDELDGVLRLKVIDGNAKKTNFAAL